MVVGLILSQCVLLSPGASGAPGLPREGEPPWVRELSWRLACALCSGSGCDEHKGRISAGLAGGKADGWLPLRPGCVPAPAAMPTPGSKCGVSPWGDLME